MTVEEREPEAPKAPTTSRRLPSVGRIADLVWKLIFNSIKRLSQHNGSQLAAAMSYYGLFAIFPAGIVIAAGAGFFLNDPAARQDAVDYLFEQLPVSATEGRDDLANLVDGVASNSGTLTLIGVIGLLISASGLIGAARISIDRIFGGAVTRGALRGKAIDVLLIVGLGLLFVASFASTLLGNLDVELTGEVGAAIEAIMTGTGALLPLALTALVIGVLYRVLPVQHPPLRQTWPGIVFATLGIEVLKRAFSFYLTNVADYSAVYGSLGAVIAFMFFAYLSSIVFLLGAEMAAIWPGVRRGDFDGDGDGDPLLTQVRDALLGLFRRNRAERPHRDEPRM